MTNKLFLLDRCVFEPHQIQHEVVQNNSMSANGNIIWKAVNWWMQA